MMPERGIQACAEKVRNNTLDYEKYDVRYSEGRPVGKSMSDST